MHLKPGSGRDLCRREMYASLREVTREDILDAVAARDGLVIQHRVVALRSLFGGPVIDCE